jgi:hypothetical protein
VIVAVCSAFEEPWIDEPIRHLYANGIDVVLVSIPPTDTLTINVASQAKAVILRQEGPFAQDVEMTRLATLATGWYHPDWIVPFDADEYWIDPLGRTIADVLDEQPPSVTRIYCAMFAMLDFERRVVDQKPFGKVAFRPHPDMKLSWGQHDIYLPDGHAEHGLLEVRELQYRDRAHWDQKIDKARRLFDTGAVPTEFGGHMRALVNASPEELDTLWRIYQESPTVSDPIPVRGNQ